MGIWFTLVALTALTVIFGLWPLVAGREGASALDHAKKHFEALRAELARQEAEGLVSTDERLAAEAEQGRRLIALERSESTQRQGMMGAARRRKAAALAMLVLVPGFSLATYLQIGRPFLPDQPLLQRMDAPRGNDMADAIRRIEAHLLKNPNDGEGYKVVAPVYLRMGRYADAARAFRQVIALLGETPERQADLGESLIALESGIINAEAKAAFERALQLDAGHAKSRFYLAVTLEQDGDVAGAVNRLAALAADLPEGAQRQRIEIELARLRPPPANEADKTISGLPDAEQQALIRTMVDGLAERLAGSGGSIEEWQRLIQARLVLGERDKAVQHLNEARKANASEPAMLERLAGLATRLGLASP